MVFVSEDGQPLFAKPQVVGAHQPGTGPKFTRVEMSDMKIIDHGTAAVVTCRGSYEGPKSSASLKFLRVWLKKNNEDPLNSLRCSVVWIGKAGSNQEGEVSLETV